MPPRKRTKKADNEPAENPTPQAVRRNVRGRRGGLKDMPGMPLDVLIEIFGFMHPRDLLNLARTSKPFRALLMSRSAHRMWKASIESVDDLPKCPSYMCEPAYVNLLFFPHCHGCLKPNVQTVIFEFGARYCNGCKPKMLVQRIYTFDLMQELIKVTGAGAVGQPFALFREGHGSHHLRWHKPEIDAFRAEWNSLPDADSKKVLVATAVARVKMMHEALPAFRNWRDKQKSKRFDELHQIKVERFDSIKTKLGQEGWAEELNLMNPWQQRLMQDKFASKAEPLTQRAWQKVRDGAVAYMEETKKHRLEIARKVILRGRFELFAKAYKTYRGANYRRTAESDLEPHLVDLAVMDESRAILDVPEDADMSILRNEEEMRNLFDDVILSWRADRRTEFTNMVVQSTLVHVPQGTVDPLTLSSALFACRLCKRADLRYPAVIAHVCNRVIDYQKEVYASTAADYLSPTRSQSPWSAKYISLSAEAISVLPPILKACGLDPVRATLKEMDDCPVRLTCKGCSEAVSVTVGLLTRSYTSFFAYTCWTALNRAIVATQCIPRGKLARDHHWVRVSKDEQEAIKKLENDTTAPRGAVNVNKWLQGCHYCDYAARPRKMSRHLKHRHDIDVGGEVQDVGNHAYRHHDGKPKSNHLYLQRHADGSAVAEYGSIISPFGWDIDSDYDYDYDSDMGLGLGLDMWDSDEMDFDLGLQF